MARNRLSFDTNDDSLSIFSTQDTYDFEEGENVKSAAERRREIYMIMERCRQKCLTPLESQCIELKFYKGMKNKEIAKALGKSEPNVCKTLKRAERTMKNILWVAGVGNFS